MITTIFVLCIIAAVFQAFGLLFKTFAIIDLCRRPEASTTTFERYAAYSYLFTVFFEFVFIFSAIVIYNYF